jgi:hypothetical protein
MKNETQNLTIAEQVLLAMENLRDAGVAHVSRATLWNYFETRRMTASRGGKLLAPSLSCCVTTLVSNKRLVLVRDPQYDIQHFALPTRESAVVDNSVTGRCEEEREIEHAARWLMLLRGR